MHLSLVEYLVVLVAGGVGAAVQGALGFGANLIAVPVVAIVVPEALPATLVLWVVPLVIAMAIRERHGVDWSGVRWTTLGRIPGTVLGAWVASTVASQTLSVLCGVGVLLAVATSLATADVPLVPATKTAAGFASGAMGTATSIGGPPLALLYQRQDGRVLRSTLAMAFTIGTATSLTGLTLAGAVEPWHVGLALALTPGLAGGLACSGALARRLDGALLRPAVLALATIAALVAVVRGLA
ncbi:MAG TPA: sulfite exporter TauE/SafE family protein [Acidimicrobiales bacterium]